MRFVKRIKAGIIGGMHAEARLAAFHDYLPAGRGTTMAEQRASNIRVPGGISEAEFVAMRTARDATLAAPTLILPSLQVNVRASQLPPAADNRVRYLRIPLNTLLHTSNGKA